MEGYRTLTEAVAVALKVCDSWYDAENEETIGAEDMSYIAQIIDLESPNTSDEIYYVVFPDGEIGILCTYDRSISRLFIPSDSDFVPCADMLLTDDAMPVPDNTTVRENSGNTKKQYRYCTNCGSKIRIGSKFCTECGQKVEV